MDGNNCCGTTRSSARTAWQNDLAAANPVAVVGPGGTTCVKSVASNSNRQTLAGYGRPPGRRPVVLSESSTATPVASDRSIPEPRAPERAPRTRSAGLSAVSSEYYGWGRIAVVYDATAHLGDVVARDAREGS